MAKAAKTVTAVGKTPSKGKTQFQPGNDWWKKRATHGREKIFTSPEAMEEAAIEYFKHAASTIVYEGKPRPLSLEALCVFLGVNSAYFRQFEARIRNNEIENGADFSTVIGNIKEIINVQQYEGALTGMYKENIIARKLGLHDTTNIQHSGAIDMPAPIIQVNSSGVSLASNENQVDVPDDKKEGDV